MLVLLFFRLIKHRGDIGIYDVIRDLKKMTGLNVLKMTDKWGWEPPRSGLVQYII
jgi:hypothetical protein